MYGQGTMIGSKFINSSLAIGLMIAGKILLFPGLIMIIIGSTTYDDDLGAIFITIGSVAFVSGLILVIIGAVFYYRIRKNPIRNPLLPVMTVGPVGAYPANVHPATLYPSSTAYVVPPGYMPQGVQATQGMQEPQDMQVPPPYATVVPPYAQGPSANHQTSYGFAQKS